MGLTFRKSFKIGPTRINLSSKGIGTSVGVRGFRVGTSASGRGYVNAGRGMLCYRASAGRSNRAPLLTAADTSAAPSANPSAGCLFVLGAVVTLFALVVFFASGYEGRLLIGFGLVGLACFAIWAYMERAKRLREEAEQEQERQRRVLEFGEAINTFLANPIPTEADAQRVADLRERLPELPERAIELLESAYRSAVAEAVADQKVTAEEQKRLSLLASAFSLSPDFVRRAHLAGFIEGFYALIADGKLTEEEDEKLLAMRSAFGVPQSEIAPILAKADQLRRARAVEVAADLEPVSADVKLKKGEACFYRAPASEMRLYVNDDFRSVKDGCLYVTNQRLLFVGEGTTTIGMHKIMRLDTEPKREGGEVVALAVDGRKTPLYLDTAEPFVLLAHINRVLAG
jgi:hypothetical protein